jgi:hypothetical protein
MFFLSQPQTGFTTSKVRDANALAGNVGAGALSNLRLAPQTRVTGKVGDAAAGFADARSAGRARKPDEENE